MYYLTHYLCSTIHATLSKTIYEALVGRETRWAVEEQLPLKYERRIFCVCSCL